MTLKNPFLHRPMPNLSADESPQIWTFTCDEFLALGYLPQRAERLQSVELANVERGFGNRYRGVTKPMQLSRVVGRHKSHSS